MEITKKQQPQKVQEPFVGYLTTYIKYDKNRHLRDVFHTDSKNGFVSWTNYSCALGHMNNNDAQTTAS